jgi:hypothetical protein
MFNSQEILTTPLKTTSYFFFFLFTIFLIGVCESINGQTDASFENIANEVNRMALNNSGI